MSSFSRGANTLGQTEESEENNLLRNNLLVLDNSEFHLRCKHWLKRLNSANVVPKFRSHGLQSDASTSHTRRPSWLKVLVWPFPASQFGVPCCASNANSENSFLLLQQSKTLQVAGKSLKCPLLRRERVKWMENGNISLGKTQSSSCLVYKCKLFYILDHSPNCWFPMKKPPKCWILITIPATF